MQLVRPKARRRPVKQEWLAVQLWPHWQFRFYQEHRLFAPAHASKGREGNCLRSPSPRALGRAVSNPSGQDLPSGFACSGCCYELRPPLRVEPQDLFASVLSLPATTRRSDFCRCSESGTSSFKLQQSQLESVQSPDLPLVLTGNVDHISELTGFVSSERREE